MTSESKGHFGPESAVSILLGWYFRVAQLRLCKFYSRRPHQVLRSRQFLCRNNRVYILLRHRFQDLNSCIFIPSLNYLVEGFTSCPCLQVSIALDLLFVLRRADTSGDGHPVTLPGLSLEMFLAVNIFFFVFFRIGWIETTLLVGSVARNYNIVCMMPRATF